VKAGTRSECANLTGTQTHNQLPQNNYYFLPKKECLFCVLFLLLTLEIPRAAARDAAKLRTVNPACSAVNHVDLR
jgi:hypothetical protein